MKIKTKVLPYEEVMCLPRARHYDPIRPSLFFRTLVRAVGSADLKATGFTYSCEDMEKLGNEPCLILMNHSSFLDLEIVPKILYPKPYAIVCTSDGFVGKSWLMRHIGCIPTQKFVSDVTLIRDMNYALKKKHMSVLMYPEASYSFDGCATPLPRRLGRLLKMLNVPVMMIRTYGAFARDPLYNNLQKRNVKVSATVKGLLSREEIAQKTVEELDGVLDSAFSFDNFAWQFENRVPVSEPFRADGLERMLYQCPSCKSEGKMHGKGTALVCSACGKRYCMDEYGRLSADRGKTEFTHIPDWYHWERENVRQELENGTYSLDTDVDIGVMVDYKAIYMVGQGHLHHGSEGFTLTGCEGKLEYHQGPLSSYGLYSDYYWYEIGDVVCIGDRDALYYCFPKRDGIVAKTRLAAEELYKLQKAAVRIGDTREKEPAV